MRRAFKNWGTRLPLPLILIVIVGLNVYWSFTLSAFGTQFEQVSGYQPLDLQNVQQILSPQAAIAQAATYSAEAKAMYWSFFILDNLMPPLVFGSFILLWASVLARNPNPVTQRILGSPLMFIPLGVGLFDCMENLAFMTAIARLAEPQATAIMQLGLTFVQLKAICLFATFGITLLLIGYGLIAGVRRLTRGNRPALQTQRAGIG